jgi:hypothetical protein
MRRLELIELHDHPWFPGLLRDLMTDALQELWRFGNTYRCILARLEARVAEAAGDGPTEILDLCSGGGGPWPSMAPAFAGSSGVTIRLTDKYPNLKAFRGFASEAGARLDFVAQPVDATAVPAGLRGFRTIFSTFHHFGPSQARRVLASAVAAGRGIGVFEVARRSPRTLVVLGLAPLLVLFLTPRVRPFRWSRLVFTYLLPAVPFVIGFDGLVSCLRAYSLEELKEMVGGLESQEYRWEVGEERRGVLAVTYLIGCPVGLGGS